MNAPGVRSGMPRSLQAWRLLTALPRSLIAQIRQSGVRSRARRDLRRLLEADRRILDDIGVTRDAVYRELDGL